MSDYVLHNFFRSSTSFRVRIALNLKGICYRQETYVLRKGEQRSEAYLALNNQGLVPTLITPEGERLTQSLAIIEYMEQIAPEPRLIPKTPLDAAYVRSLAYRIACDIHPLNNLRVLGYLQKQYGRSEEDIAAWFRHWMVTEFDSLEATLAGNSRTGAFCLGDTPTLADVCLIPQVINGGRFDIGVDNYPTIRRIHERALELPAFEEALPANQPDAQ